jgi:hypothetical protein
MEQCPVLPDCSSTGVPGSNLRVCQVSDIMLTCKHMPALQLGQLVNLNPIDLLGDSIPDVGVPPLNVPNLLGVQFLGACHIVGI